jgi:hypothetical protein
MAATMRTFGCFPSAFFSCKAANRMFRIVTWPQPEGRSGPVSPAYAGTTECRIPSNDEAKGELKECTTSSSSPHVFPSNSLLAGHEERREDAGAEMMPALITTAELLALTVIERAAWTPRVM